MRTSKGNIDSLTVQDRSDLFASSIYSDGNHAAMGGFSETDGFLQNQLNVKSESLERQDEIMNQLHESVQRFGEQTLNMKNEIDDHIGLITSMQNDLEQNQSTLDLLNDKAASLIQKSGGECRVILILSVVCLALFLLLVYS